MLLGGCDQHLPDAPSTARVGSAALVGGSPTAPGEPIRWGSLSADQLWEHVAAVDSAVVVGLKQPGMRRGVSEQGVNLLSEQAWRGLSRQLEPLGVEVTYVDGVQPVAELRLTGPAQVEALRRSPFVAYVEPADLGAQARWQDSFSCGTSPIAHPGSPHPPGDLVPWTLARHSVPQAWTMSTGEGVTIGFVDTGISAHQPQLQHEFATGLSTGRTIEYLFTAAASGSHPWHDTCGHGTKLAGIAAAPRNGHGTAGVAYRANVVAVRAGSGTDFGPFTWRDVRDAVDVAAERSRIVNISLGSIYHYDTIADRIKYWYYDAGSRRLFIGAAGTSPWAAGSGSDGTVFPASLPEVVAVTGLDPSQPNTLTAPCSACWRGPKVEFASRIAGDAPYLWPGDFTGAGGSSAATGHVSGIAALVWSRYPHWTREQVLARMREAAQPRDNRVGHGPINAFKAVGGLVGVSVGGPGRINAPGTYEFYLVPDGGEPPYTFSWSATPGGSGTSSSFFLNVETYAHHYFLEITATVRDSNGAEVYTTRSVLVQGDGSTCGGEIPCQ